ncbi:MAG: tRNA (adenosine(37)-N6)-threonylcarbamoyltransferase complex dimerization subunit type 1 TsaB [Thalassolituus sp.]
MPVILTIDASSSLCSVALDTGTELNWSTEDQPRRHAQRLLPMVDELLADSGISKNSLDGVAFGRGPGSFTGIRIAVAVAHGLSLGLDIPVCGISALEAIALAASRESDEQQFLTLMDAHMGEVFWGAFQREGNLVHPISAEHVSAPEACIDALSSFTGTVAGDGLQLTPFEAYISDGLIIRPEARVMAALAAREWQSGGFGEPEEHSPVYLRQSVAWKKIDEQPSLLKRS